MRNAKRFLCVGLLVAFGVSVGWGWGNMAHVYFSKQLGVRVGVLNLNEMYGSLLTDMVNYDFSASGQALAGALHTDLSLTWGLYGSATTRAGKAAFYGMFTHNNVWGVDYTAHDNGMTVGDEGWVIHYGAGLEGPIAEYLTSLFVAQVGGEAPMYAELSAYLAHTMAHDVIEQAVDVLIKRYNDPLVGARLCLAANARTKEVPQVLEAVFGPEVGPMLAQGEEEYREALKRYGQLFMQPERKMIPQMCALSAGIAHDYIKGVTAQDPSGAFPGGVDLVVDPGKVGEFLMMAIAIVKPVYNEELQATLQFVEANLLENNVLPAGPVLACFQKGGIEEEMIAEDAADAAAQLPSEFALAQNFPNPFNPSTRISFALPADGKVSLTVYNTLGQEVATLINEARPAGRYDVIWNAAGMPSGVYFYRIQSGTFVETKRMTLVK